MKNPEDAEIVRLAYSPGRAKALGGSLLAIDGLEERKYGIMCAVVKIKFYKSADLRERLLKTGDVYLEEGDLDLTRSREHLKAIRRGEFPKEYIVEYFDKKLIILEELYGKSTLRYSPDESFLKNILLECLEMHYGSLDKMVSEERNIDKHIIEAYNALEKAMRMIK